MFEILEARFFAIETLPETTTRGVRDRLAEVLGTATRSAIW